MTRPPRALLFDLDGTLLDDSGIRDAIARTCSVVAAAHPGLDADQLLAANSSVWSSYWPEVEERWLCGILDSPTVSLEGWRRSLRACGIEDEALAKLAEKTLSREERRTYRLYDDTRDVIDGLHDQFLVGLITNGAAATQREKLRATRIESAFGVVVISAEVGAAKPDAGIFHYALEALGVLPAEAWHIGDNLRNDVAGARSAGLTAVWLNRDGAQRGAGDAEPDIELRTLSELRRYLWS